MKNLVLLLFPLCCAVSGSHVLVSIEGSSYSHGTQLGQPFKSPVPETQVYQKETKIPEDSIETYHLPVQVFTTSAPLYYKSPTSGHQTSAKVFLTEAPSGSTIAPVHISSDNVYHSSIKYLTTQKVLYTQNTTPTPSTTPPMSTTQPFKTKSKLSPKKQFTILEQDEVVKTEVCIPRFETRCASVDLDVKVIVDKEQCQNITHTVCSSADEVIKNKICVYEYEKKTEESVAKTVTIAYAKECTNHRVTVCQPFKGYQYQSYEQQYCKEDDQQSCYNVPTFTMNNTDVSVTLPAPIKSCTHTSTTIQRITCKDMVENKCMTVPEVKEETQKIDKCEVVIGEPSCQEVSLTLPMGTFNDLAYGNTAQHYHEKVL